MTMSNAVKQSGLSMLLLAVGAGGASASAALLEPALIGAQTPAMRGMWSFVIGTAGASALLVPGLLLIRGRISSFARRVRETPERGTPLAASTGGMLTPVARAADELAEFFMSRIESASSRVREAEIRLSVSESERRHYESILDGLNDAVIVTDTFNEITLANNAANDANPTIADKCQRRTRSPRASDFAIVEDSTTVKHLIARPRRFIARR